MGTNEPPVTNPVSDVCDAPRITVGLIARKIWNQLCDGDERH